MKNLKDTLTTIAAIIAALCGFIIILGNSGITLPTWLIIVCGAIPTFCTTVIGVLTGRNADGTKKTL